MRAMRLRKYQRAEERPLVMYDQNKPEPGPGQVRLRVRFCGVCHTDLHTVEGDIHPAKLPITPGHQVVGIVDSLGAGVFNTKIGERVGVPWLYSADGECEFCLNGLENLCVEGTFTGFHVDGGFAEYMVADARFLHQLPSEIGDDQAAPLLCAGIIGYRSIRIPHNPNSVLTE